MKGHSNCDTWFRHMERRESRRTESLRASQRIKTLLWINPKLDPSLWSKLPKENLLDIFDALPVKEYYRLRTVCKHWHNRASERCRLPAQDQVHVREPFFLLIRTSQDQCQPCGTLALQAESGRWMWQLHRHGRLNWRKLGHLLESFEVEGVLFHEAYMSESRNHQYFLGRGSTDALFDVHRNYGDDEKPGLGELAKRIPHLDAAPGSVLGMMVDDASRAYTLILGSCVADTLVLDSHTNEWESKPSRLVRARPPSVSTAPKSCVQLQDKMYLWIDSNEIHVYSPSFDKWSALARPPRDASDENEFRCLGQWAGTLYAMTKNEQGTLSVWKLNMSDEQWSEYAQIPGCLFAHLMQVGVVLPIVASHCNGYLLVHVLAQPPEKPNKKTHLGKIFKRPVPKKLDRRFVLFNIANRRWEMVDMPYSKLWRLPYKFKD